MTQSERKLKKIFYLAVAYIFFIQKLSLALFLIFTSFICYAHDLPLESNTRNPSHQETNNSQIHSAGEENNSPILLTSFSSKNSKVPVTLKGDIPFFEFPHLQKQSNLIWSFIKETVSLPSEVSAPIIHFFPFDRQKQDQKWTDWQNQWLLRNPSIWIEYSRYAKISSAIITPEWIKKTISHALPFPKHFIAFHYDNTNQIQINPKTAFLSFYQNDPYGVKKDLTGLGFYIMGHEMLHYAFQEKKILPSKNHHCLFILPLLPNKQSVLEALSTFLIDSRLSSSTIKILGLKQEESFQPCQNIRDKPSITEKAILKLTNMPIDL